MNYTTEDLAKIKQLVGTTDMNNVIVGIQIAKGLGITAETLASLFTVDDIQFDDIFDRHHFNAFGEEFWSVVSLERCYQYYTTTFVIEELLNE
mgnify:CR=1 FL=1